MSDLELLQKLSMLNKQGAATKMESDSAVAKMYLHETQTMGEQIPDDWLLVLKSGIAGMSFHVNADQEHGARALGELVPGTELCLERDYKNVHDKWAIAIYSPKKEMLGYMTRYKNETIARLMDYGKIFHAIVDKPVEFERDNSNIEKIKTPTENFALPYSVYMEDE